MLEDGDFSPTRGRYEDLLRRAGEVPFVGYMRIAPSEGELAYYVIDITK
jgi:hypothetical protein